MREMACEREEEINRVLFFDFEIAEDTQEDGKTSSRQEADAAGGRRDREFLVQRSRFLAALKTRLGLFLAKAVAMRVMINATGCPAPASARNRMKAHKHLSQPIASAIDHDIPTPV